MCWAIMYRQKLVGAYSDKSPLVQVLYLPEDGEVLLSSSAGRYLLLHTEELAAKATRSTQGVAVMTLRKNVVLTGAGVYTEGQLKDPARYRKKIPAIGALPTEEEQLGEQMTL